MFAVKKPPQAAAHSGVFCLRSDVLENLSCLRQDLTFSKSGDFGRLIQLGMEIERLGIMKCNINERKNDWLWLVDALENFEYHIVSLMLDDMCCTKKTVRSHSPDEKYNLLAGGGRSGQCGQWQCSYWGLVTASLDTLNLIIVARRISPSRGLC